MSKAPAYNARNRNQRTEDAPLSWSQRFYDRKLDAPPKAPLGFRERGR